MAALRIIIDSRNTAPWAGSHADLKVVNDTLSVCFQDLREQEQSEWEAGNPEPEAPSQYATALEKLAAEHHRLKHTISRLTMDDRFTDFFSYELLNRPIRVMGSFQEISPSLNSERIKHLYMAQSYFRDDIRATVSARFGGRGVEVTVDGSDPLWVESSASAIAQNLRRGKPRWAPLLSPWGHLLFQLAFVSVVAAIIWRLMDGFGGAAPWWGLIAAVYLSSFAMGNPESMNWLLPRVDIYTPGSQPAGTAHLKWVGGAVAAGLLAVIIDILLRG
jgi:hypothetical protein